MEVFKMNEEKMIEAKETVQIGDKIYNVEDVTPSVYFDYVKGAKKNIEPIAIQVMPATIGIADTPLFCLTKI